MAATEEVDILLVEDTDSDATLTMRALRSAQLNQRIHWAKDGAEALEFLFPQGDEKPGVDARLPKLVLLDIKLPKIDGIEVLRRIKSDEYTQPIPVVVLTSSGQEQDLVETYRLGVNSYITKPVAFDDFMRVVAEVGVYWAVLNKVPYQPTPML